MFLQLQVMEIGIDSFIAVFSDRPEAAISDADAMAELLDRIVTADRAGLDVFEIEPVPADDPILKLSNAILAPHALCWTDQCFAGNGAADVRAALDISKGIVPRGVVNRAVLDSAVFKAKLADYAKRFG